MEFSSQAWSPTSPWQMQKEMRQCVITDSLTEDTKVAFWGGLTLHFWPHLQTSTSRLMTQ